jgi:predicted TIM-barrel fold metal-dependent hydrolase
MKCSGRFFAIALIISATCLGISTFCYKSVASFARESPAGNSAVNAELKAFAAVDPVDVHAHVFKRDPAFVEMLRQLRLHLVDIVVVDDTSPRLRSLKWQVDNDLSFVRSSAGYAVFCTSFDPYKLNQPDFAKLAIKQLDENFDQGAIAVKIWKNIGMEIKKANGEFVLPDDPLFEPIYRDIANHNKTMIAHIAEPDQAWLPPNPKNPDNSYYVENPQWWMYKKPDHPSKATILAARDRMLAENPKLRVVGAHLGSMEADLDELGRRFDRYPNFAVDTAARIHHLMLQSPQKVRAFLIKYQDRVVYGTDLGLMPDQDTQKAIDEWEATYLRDWKYFAEAECTDEKGRKVAGLSLPTPVLHKLFHENAVHWFPGV